MNIFTKFKNIIVTTLRGRDVLADQEMYQATLRQLGAAIGHNCRIFSNIIGPETYLITLEDMVTIATGVKIITHDNAISKPLPEFTDLFGRVTVRRNSFIGAYSVLLPGITVGENAIVAAGSVVTKSIPDGEIWGGVPAKKIGETMQYAKKQHNKAISTRGLSYEEKKSLLLSSNKLIQR